MKQGLSHGARGAGHTVRATVEGCTAAGGGHEVTQRNSKQDRLAESLGLTPETNVTLCVNYPSISKKAEVNK